MSTKLTLSDITLVCYDVRANDLAAQAVKYVTAQVDFADVLLFSNHSLNVSGIATIPVDGADGPMAAAQFMWYEAPKYVRTSHYLNMEWDSGILSLDCWTEKFLNYDFIGAPWPWHPVERRVGNGGWSLRSKKMMEFLQKRSVSVQTPEDVALSVTYRPLLESLGFMWAPLELADIWSFERGIFKEAFGFHGAYNFPKILPRDEFLLRMDLANSYVRNKADWGEMLALAKSYGF